MAYNSSNEANIVRQQVYDASLEKSLDDWLVGMPLFDDKTGVFPDGDTLQITKTGDRAVSDYSEDTAITFDNMQTSRVTLAVTDYKQDAWYITDQLKQDGWQAEEFWSENVRKSGIAMERDMETAVLATANLQPDGTGNLNLINGRAHRYAGKGTGGAITVEDIAAMKLAFDKAYVPTENRVLIVSPEMAFELDKLVNITEVSNGSTFNFDFDGLVQTGFGDRLNVVRNIYGFNIIISHNLPDVSETIAQYDNTGSATITGKGCIAMSMASASDMPFMGVIRQRPQSEFFRNTHYKRDEWSATCRYGFGLKRAETLGVIVTPV